MVGVQLCFVVMGRRVGKGEKGRGFVVVVRRVSRKEKGEDDEERRSIVGVVVVRVMTTRGFCVCGGRGA
jgi:hypothetical protein